MPEEGCTMKIAPLLISHCGNKWDKEKAESILRSFNYPLISDIYYSMYRIAKQYGLYGKKRC